MPKLFYQNSKKGFICGYKFVSLNLRKMFWLNEKWVFRYRFFMGYSNITWRKWWKVKSVLKYNWCLLNSLSLCFSWACWLKTNHSKSSSRIRRENNFLFTKTKPRQGLNWGLYLRPEWWVTDQNTEIIWIFAKTTPVFRGWVVVRTIVNLDPGTTNQFQPTEVSHYDNLPLNFVY